MQIYFNDWNDEAEMISSFGITPEHVAPYDVLLATYSYEDWTGYAFVLLRHRETGELYEVNGAHCSCYDLSDGSYSGTQWEPEQTAAAAVRMRQWSGRHGDTVHEALIALLDGLEQLPA